MSKVMAGAVLVGLCLVMSKVPHVQLASQLALGQIEGPGIVVENFVSADFDEDVATFHCGELVMEIPARLLQGSLEELQSLSMDWDGLQFLVMPPRKVFPDETGEAGPLNPMPDQDEITRRTCICAADENRLSFWMSMSEVEEFREQLEARRFFCLSAERVEVVRGKTLSGLLLSWNWNGQLRIVFEYFSPDHRTAGSMVMLADAEPEKAMEKARALIGSLRLEGAGRG